MTARDDAGDSTCDRTCDQAGHGPARRHVLRRIAARAAGLLAVCAAPAVRAQSGPPAAAQEDLIRAIRRDDPHAVRTALLRGADANAPAADGEPPLVRAAREKAWNAVRALAELRGTRLDATDRGGANALMFASLHGELPMVRFLVGRKAGINKTGWTPLHFAAANGHLDVIRYLLEHHAYIDAESPNGTTPLMMAARQAQPSAVRLLVDEGADPTPLNEAGLDAARYARAAGDPALADWLAKQSDAFRHKYGTPAAGR